ncbi:MAG TPA: LON peptidase substrate-binding domain-containing protein [Caulobacteraceae bacterium]
MSDEQPEAAPKAEDLPQVIPLFPLDGALLLPHASRPLNIFEPRYLNMLDDVMAAERIVGMVQTAPGGTPERPFLAHVGCAGRVTSFGETPDGRYLISLTGLCRFHLETEISSPTPYRQARVDYSAYVQDLEPRPTDTGADRQRLLDALTPFLEHRSLRIDWGQLYEAPIAQLVDSLAMALPFDHPELQALLEAPTLDARRQTLITLLEIDGAEGGDEHTARQ